MPDTVVVVLLPALSVQVAVADRFAPSPVTVLTAGSAAGPEPVSVQVQATVTSSLVQPLVLGMPVTPAEPVLPAASTAVPPADWLAPAPSTSDFEQASIPEPPVLSVHS